MSDRVRPDLTWVHPAGSSLVFLGEGASDRAVPWLERWAGGRKIFLVTTPRVGSLYLDDWRRLLAVSADLVVLRVDEGEAAKSLDSAANLWTEMLRTGGRRDSRIVALGGGSVGDLAGFVAATFLRGVDIVQAPTTLLAQVDASIGGKTAIDLPEAKNCVGALHHPAAVVADVGVLASLPSEEFRSGLVEVIKIGAADDLPLFESLEGQLDCLLPGASPAVIGPMVHQAVAAKIRVIEEDLADTGRRRILNLGHTLGHAIESVLEYRTLRHGEAVAYGLLFAARLAARRGGDRDWGRRLRRLIGRLDLPPLPELGIEGLLDAMQRDKKATRDGVVWVLPTGPGQVEIVDDIPMRSVGEALPPFLRDPLAEAE